MITYNSLHVRRFGRSGANTIAIYHIIVVNVDVVQDQGSTTHRGIGFITFANAG